MKYYSFKDKETVTYTRKEIFHVLKAYFYYDLDIQFDIIEKFINKHFDSYSLKIYKDEAADLKQTLFEMKMKWATSEFIFEWFFDTHNDWLNETLKIVCVRVITSDSTKPNERKTRKSREDLSLKELHAPIEMTGDEALVEIIEGKLTKQSYLDIRSSLRQKNFNAYPSYGKVAEAKARCYPEDITVTKDSAEVKLQSLLNHTCDRILMVQMDVINTLLLSEVFSNVRLICKWGCGGSSGQSEYQQKFTSHDSSDSHIFLTSLVPLQIVGFNEDSEKDIIIWKNPKPSSTRFCRPIHIQFLKNTEESTESEKQYIENQIASLQSFITVINGQEINVKFEMYFTEDFIGDPETIGAMRCDLCRSISFQFIDIKLMGIKKIDSSAFEFGLSTLHAWVGFLEYFVHVGYTRECRTPKLDRSVYGQRECVIQEAFKNQLGLNIDNLKLESINSNDANTARRFFENYVVSAGILGVDANLMKRAYVILQVISSGFAVNVNTFQEYCFETAKMCISLYPWYFMSKTVHGILIHGLAFIELSPVPIGQMCEDVEEARNKNLRNDQVRLDRKSSRNVTMQNVFNRFLVTSDPLISSKRMNHPKSKHHLSREVKSFLIGRENEHIYGMDDYELGSSDESTDMEDDFGF